MKSTPSLTSSQPGFSKHQIINFICHFIWDPVVCGILNWMDKSSIFMVLTFLLIIAEARAFKMSTGERGEFSINFNINWIEIQYLGTCWMPRRGISLYWNIQYSRACSKQSLSTTLFDDSYLIVKVWSHICWKRYNCPNSWPI